MFRTLFHLIFNRHVAVFLALVLVSLVIWLIGPLFYIKPYQPLESETVRGWLIASLFGAWLLYVVLRVWRSQNMNQRMAQQLARLTTRADGTQQTPQPGEAEVGELETRFKDAVLTLSKTRMGQTEGGVMGWLTKRYLYQLPWYLIIGAPGSGKTTALVNSGLNFPLEAEYGKGAVRGAGGTRNCDWWFTDEAVLLDTAGRYTTQESDGAHDKATWRGFLQLLKRFRKRQPINGVIVTLSVSDLLSKDETQRKNLAHTIGQRLSELCEELALQFPVYVWITKTDLLAGFQEFFGHMTREERAQVWGFTHPFAEDTATLVSSSNATSAFDTQFDALTTQIHRLLPERLLKERDAQNRNLIYALPQQFAGLKQVIKETLDVAFANSRLKEKPLLRGVYFTSGTQEGRPFDRVMSSLLRRFGMNPKAQEHMANASVTKPVKGRSYFLETLLKEVIFNEAGLTGRNAKKERQLRWLQISGFVALGLGLVGMAVAWSVSHHHNQLYLDEVRGNAEMLQQAIEEAKSADPQSLVALLPLLNHAESMAVTERHIGPAPMSWRWGLLQIPKVQTAADATYMRLLEQAWLPRLVQHLRRTLQQTSVSNPEASYEALKMYLMLHDPDHFDPQPIKAWMLYEWQRTLPPQLQDDNVMNPLNHHLDRLVDGRVVVSPMPIDAALVAEVRQRLAQMSPAQRAYSRIKQLLRNSKDLPPAFTLVRAAGPEAAQVFMRRSGLPLTQGISGLFTYDGYHRVFVRAAATQTALLAKEESWVLGEADGKRNTAKEILSGSLVTEVKRLYLMEYAKTWEDFLADVQPVAITTLEQAGEQARLYSAPNSALELFIRTVARETTLSKPLDPDGNGNNGAGGNGSWLEEKKRRLKEETQQLSQLMGTPVNAGGVLADSTLEAEIVDSRFREYRRLATSNGSGPAPIAASLQVMAEAAAMISASKQQVPQNGGSVPPALNATLEKVRTEAKRVPSPLNVMYDKLATATSQQVGGLVGRELSKNLNADVGQSCRQTIQGRYPFNSSARQDVTAGDFSNLFAAGGKMDQFFQTRLKDKVDTGKTPWAFMQGVDGTPLGGTQALYAFQQAATLRDVFFRGGGTAPSMRLDIKPLEMDANIAQMTLDVDGDSLRYQHGPQISKSITWPRAPAAGGGSGTGTVRLQLSMSSGENSGFSTEGPWALHRLFDKAQIVPGSSPERFTATFNVEGHQLRFEVITSSVLNPFRLSALKEFRCPTM